MTYGLVTRSAERDEVVGVVTMRFGVVKYVVNVKLGGSAGGSPAQRASVLVAALDDLAYGLPPWPTVAVAPTLPVRASVAYAPVHWVADALARAAHVVSGGVCKGVSGVGV